MSRWDDIGTNWASSALASEYFESLETAIDTEISSFLTQEEQWRKQTGASNGLGTVITKQTITDARGCEYLQYKSRNAAANIYSNYPIGYVYCEIYKLVPYANRRKCFAVSIPPSRWGQQSAPVSYGDFPVDTYAGTSHVATLIIDDLVSSKLDSELLKLRKEYCDE